MTKDQHKTKRQLMEELEVLRRRIASLEKIEGVTRQAPSGNSLVEQASDGIFVAIAQGNIVDVNTGGCEMLGYSRDELLQMRIHDLVPKEDLAVEPIHFDAYRDGKTLVVQRRLRRKDGLLLPVEVSTKMLPDGRLFGIVRDITERERAEQTLKQSRDTLRTLLECLPMGVSLIVDGQIVFTNPALAAMYGYSSEEILGKTPADFLPAGEKARAASRIQEFFQGGPAPAAEFDCLHADGTLFPVEITSRIIEFDENPALLNIHRDLTERKKGEADLQKTNETLRALIEACPLTIVAMDADGRTTLWNPAAEQTFGWSEQEVLGRFPPTVMEQDVPKMIDRLRQGVAANGHEVSRVRRDGRLIEMDIWTAPLRDATGKITGRIALGADITERKRLEREILEVSTREQQRIGQDLHDGLGQRLTGIAFLSKAMAQKLAARSSSEAATAAEIAELVKQAITQVRHLARGVNPVALEVGGLKAALEELGLDMERLFKVNFAVKADDVLPVLDNMTARHFYYVAQEAMTNAIKHGHSKNIEVRLVNTQEHCRLSVQDDGVGFSPEAPTSSGMGLHIMRYRANIIHGSFSIRPAPNGGTMVHLSVDL